MSFDPKGNVFPGDVIDDDDPRLVEAELYLATRFYPALPAAYAPIMLAAIDLLNNDDREVMIVLPHDLNPKPRGNVALGFNRFGASPRTIVDALRVWHMVDDTIATDGFGEAVRSI